VVQEIVALEKKIGFADTALITGGVVSATELFTVTVTDEVATLPAAS